MKKLFIFIRLVIFFTIMFALIIVLGKVFTPKWKNGTLSEMDGQDYTINGYYELPKNSIDVLFLGDSSIFKISIYNIISTYISCFSWTK